MKIIDIIRTSRLLLIFCEILNLRKFNNPNAEIPDTGLFHIT